MKVDLLRLMLPPWTGGDAPDVAVRCGYRQPDGRWRDGGVRALSSIASDFSARRLEVALHPGDVPMAAFTLPPLSGRRLQAAVQGAIEPCALQPLDKLMTGFGPRGADGVVPAAWIARQAMNGWLALLRKHGLAVRELQLPAAFLPCPAQGWVASQIDRWLVVRTGPGHGFTQWLPEGTDRTAGLMAAQADGDAPLPAVQWVGDGDPAEGWSGDGWRWALSAGDAAGSGVGAALVGPAVGWGVVVIAVWLTGLNVYANQLASQGQTLKRQMAARVKAAFPDVPVVVDPVKQARQQKEALAAGVVPSATGDAPGLMRAATGLLAQAAPGQVQGLRYAAGELRVRWREGAAPSAEAWHALQAKATEQGLTVQSDAQGMRVTVASGAPAADGAAVKKGAP
ncbi:type II secretion system protein GspL [Variovorax sp. GB1P17]|uniref:type II secretion system protein GspL n=1 Tax=Variovorax sp. GB1P17 TaxID=3443740 RepID=UPI003F466527